MFDWDRFKNGEIAVHCDTEGKANDFLKQCEQRSIMWVGGDKATDHNNYSFMNTRTCYYGRKNKLTYCNTEYFRMRDVEVVKWEVKEVKELTFKEVIANIKEGEVWESNEKTITIKYDQVIIQVKEGCEGRVNGNERMALSLDKKYKLQRKEYTFEEAFKALEEGKEIESAESLGKYKKIGDIYKTNNRLGEWIFAGNSLNFHEIKGKWYIND